MNLVASRSLALVAGLTLGMSCAHALQGRDAIESDRPGLADGSAVVASGRIQLETGLQRDVSRAGDDPQRRTVLPTLLRVGFSERLEGRLESDVHAWLREPGGGRTQAYAPFSVGFKRRFAESLAAIVRVSPASGADAERTRHTTGDVRLASDWELSERWSLNPNIGLAIDEDDAGRRFTARSVAATLAYRPADRVELFADFAAQSPEEKGGGTGAVCDAGVAYRVSPNVQVDASLGRRCAGSAAPRGFVAAGLSVRF